MADYDAIVVGARIAGSLTASLLGERGWRVLLLDRATFPSDTLSTHFFREPALRAFQRAGVLGEVAGAGAPRLVNAYNDVDGHVFTEPLEGSPGFDYVLCVRRIVLDDILVRRVRRVPAVDFRQRATARALLWSDGHVRGLRFTRGAEEEEATARVVVGADGFRSLVARGVAPATEHAEPIRRAMYYAYFKGLELREPPAAEFHYRGNELVYVFPCDGGLTLLAVSVPTAEFPAWKRAGRELFRQRLAARAALAPRLRQAEWVGKLYGAGDIPGYMRVPFGGGWVLVGDAGMIMDPFSGQGIDQGSTHAVLLADALHRHLAGEETWASAMGGFHAARNAFSEKTYRRTCTTARDFRPMTRAALQRRGLRPRVSVE